MKTQKEINNKIMENRRTKEEVFDKYAAAALNALISKLPLLDKEGIIGEQMPEKDMVEIKEGIVRSALEYATRTMQHREEFIKHFHTEDIALSKKPRGKNVTPKKKKRKK